MTKTKYFNYIPVIHEEPHAIAIVISDTHDYTPFEHEIREHNLPIDFAAWNLVDQFTQNSNAVFVYTKEVM